MKNEYLLSSFSQIAVNAPKPETIIMMAEASPSKKSTNKKRKPSVSNEAGSSTDSKLDDNCASRTKKRATAVTPKSSKKKRASSSSKATKSSAKAIKEDPLVCCKTLLDELLGPAHSEYASPFYKPVDVIGLELDNYYDVIKSPMDLSTIKEKLDSKQYLNAAEFAADFRLMFSNCYRFNRSMDPVVEQAKKLQVHRTSIFLPLTQRPFLDLAEGLRVSFRKVSRRWLRLRAGGRAQGRSHNSFVFRPQKKIVQKRTSF